MAQGQEPSGIERLSDKALPEREGDAELGHEDEPDSHSGSEANRMTLSAQERKTLEFEYEEVARSHAAIVDFRGKLLALLPIASGAALFLLLDGRAPNAPLAAIGAFGCAVTIGLFVYELRNMQECNALIDQGKLIEEALGVPEKMGRFKDKPEAALGFVGATGAGWTVYTAVFCGWLYLAVQESWLEDSARRWVPVLFILVLTARFAVWPIGEGWRLARSRKRERRAAGLRTNERV